MLTHQQAQQIAAQYQSPGTEGIRFAEFASIGAISDPDGILDDINREKKRADVKDWFWLEELRKYIEVLTWG